MFKQKFGQIWRPAAAAAARCPLDHPRLTRLLDTKPLNPKKKQGTITSTIDTGGLGLVFDAPASGCGGLTTATEGLKSAVKSTAQIATVTGTPCECWRVFFCGSVCVVCAGRARAPSPSTLSLFALGLLSLSS